MLLRADQSMIDVRDQEIEVSISADGQTVWVNGPNGCLLRACKCKKLHLFDARFPDTQTHPDI